MVVLAAGRSQAVLALTTSRYMSTAERDRIGWAAQTLQGKSFDGKRYAREYRKR